MGKRAVIPSQKAIMAQKNASKAGNQQKNKGNQTVKEVAKVANRTVTPGTAAQRTGTEVSQIQVELTQEEGEAHKQAEIASTQVRNPLRRNDKQVMEETLWQNNGTVTAVNVSPSGATVGNQIQQLSHETQATISSQKLSWADEVESSHELNKKRSIWDSFDIIKISNAGFKLEFTEPEMHGEVPVCAIDFEDISTELAYYMG